MALAITATVLVVGTTTGTAHACSCVALSDQEAFDQADAVFEGTVTGVDTPDGPVVSSLDPSVWRFQVTDVFKGRALARQAVISPSSGASCGLELKEGERYYVFAWLDSVFETEPQPKAGQLAGHLCNGTRSVRDGTLDIDDVRARPPSDPAAREVVVTGLVRWDSASPGRSNEEVVVHFVGAPKTAKGDPCWEGYRARVSEYGDIVTITLRRLRNVPEPGQSVACSDIGALRTLRVQLPSALGDRRLSDGASNEERGLGSGD